MIIFNITTNIHESVHDKWMIWMQHKHIPEMMQTGKFLSAKMARVLVDEEMGGITYSVQYTAKDKQTLDNFYSENENEINQEGIKFFGDKMLSFKTELEVLLEF